MKKIDFDQIKDFLIESDKIGFLFVEKNDCPKCLELLRKWEQALKENDQKQDIFLLNLDENPLFSVYFRVPQTPYVFVFKNGDVFKRSAADLPEDKIEEFVSFIFNPPAKAGRYPDVKVFTTPTCPYCHMFKEYLSSKDVPFQEIDVSQDQEWAGKMVEKSGQMGVPQLWIGDEVVVGFDKARIDNLLGLE